MTTKSMQPNGSSTTRSMPTAKRWCATVGQTARLRNRITPRKVTHGFERKRHKSKYRPSSAARSIALGTHAHADVCADMTAEPLSKSESRARLGRVAILWRGDEAARSGATPETSRFKAVFAALA